MQVARSLMLLVLVAIPVRAQSSLLDESTEQTPAPADMALQTQDRVDLLSTTLVDPPKPAAPKEPARRFSPTTKLWIASSLAAYAVAALDMHTTQDTARRVQQVHRQYPAFPLDYSFEANPTARPFLKLPAPAYYACGAAFVTGINWLSLRMSRSRRFRRVWWLPQALSMAGNSYGYVSYQ